MILVRVGHHISRSKHQKNLARKSPTMGRILAGCFWTWTLPRQSAPLRHHYPHVHRRLYTRDGAKKKQSGRLTLLFYFFAGTMAVGLPTCQGGLSSWSIKPPWKLGLAALRRRTRGVQYLSYPSTGIGRESLCCSRGASTARHTWHPPFFFFFSLLLRLHILEDQCFGGLGFGPENKDLG